MTSLMKRTLDAVTGRAHEPQPSDAGTDAGEPMHDDAVASPPPSKKRAAKDADAKPAKATASAKKAKTEKTEKKVADKKAPKKAKAGGVAKPKVLSKAMQTRAFYEEGLPDYMRKFRDSNIRDLAQRAGVTGVTDRPKVHARMKHIIHRIIDETFITPGLIAMKANDKKMYDIHTLNHIVEGNDVRILGIDSSIRKKIAKKPEAKADDN